MVRRTTIEIDEDLLNRAKRAPGGGTTRATVAQALRRAAESEESGRTERAERQWTDLLTLDENLDLEVLASDEMWR